MCCVICNDALCHLYPPFQNPSSGHVCTCLYIYLSNHLVAISNFILHSLTKVLSNNVVSMVYDIPLHVLTDSHIKVNRCAYHTPEVKPE